MKKQNFTPAHAKTVSTWKQWKSVKLISIICACALVVGLMPIPALSYAKDTVESHVAVANSGNLTSSTSNDVTTEKGNFESATEVPSTISSGKCTLTIDNTTSSTKMSIFTNPEAITFEEDTFLQCLKTGGKYQDGRTITITSSDDGYFKFAARSTTGDVSTIQLFKGTTQIGSDQSVTNENTVYLPDDNTFEIIGGESYSFKFSRNTYLYGWTFTYGETPTSDPAITYDSSPVEGGSVTGTQASGFTVSSGTTVSLNDETKVITFGDASSTTLTPNANTHYSFDSWTRSSGQLTDNITADTTFTANFKGDTYDINYKDKGNVDFSGNHESSYPKTHTYGTETSLDKPTKTGYTFAGYYLNPDCTGDPVTKLGATDYTKSITLYANWTENTKYGITFNLNQGEWAEGYDVPIQYTEGVGLTLPTSDNISRENYTFGGWYDNEEFTGEPVTEISTSATGDKEYWAKWNGIPVTSVTLDKTQATLNPGETITLTATVLPEEATEKSVTWTSSDPAVATVSSDGVVTAVYAGSATITVTTNDGGKTATCAVTVQEAPVVTYTATFNFGKADADITDVQKTQLGDLQWANSTVEGVSQWTKTYTESMTWEQVLNDGWTDVFPVDENMVPATSWSNAGTAPTQEGTTYTAQWDPVKPAPTADEFTYTPPASSGGKIVYDGEQHAATITVKSEVKGMGNFTVEYQLQTTSNDEEWTPTAPTNAGTYKVRANVEAGSAYSAGTVEGDNWTFEIEKADQTAPTGLGSTPESAAGENDGTITGVTNKMEYSNNAAGPFKAVTTEPTITGLAADTYYVRFAEDTNHNVSPSTTVEVKNASAAIEDCIEAINNIGTVELTDECKAKIDNARKLYDALNDEQKAKVTNYSTLQLAESQYSAMSDLKNVADTANAGINNLENLTADEKAEYTDKVNADYEAGIKAIQNATTPDAVTTAKLAAHSAITDDALESVNKDFANKKENAKIQLQKAADEAKEAINNMPNLSNEEKATAIAAIDKSVEEAVEKIDNATTYDDVDTQLTVGVQDLVKIAETAKELNDSRQGGDTPQSGDTSATTSGTSSTGDNMPFAAGFAAIVAGVAAFAAFRLRRREF